MPGRQPKPARLYLRPGRLDRAPVWVIKDNGLEISTRCDQKAFEKAKIVFAEYCRTPGIAFDGTKFVDMQMPVPALGTVYFISAEQPADYPIKVGFTARRSASPRLGWLQNACPYKLVVMATMPGTVRDEAAILQRFAQTRLQGEWLRRSAELLQFIDQMAFNLRSGGAPPVWGPQDAQNGVEG
jgi:hypothetical protein